MKTATGHYINVYSEIGYENYGLKEKLDIFIIFPEYMTEKEIDYKKIETIILNTVETYTKTKQEDEGVNKEYLLMHLKKELLFVDCQVVLNIRPW